MNRPEALPFCTLKFTQLRWELKTHGFVRVMQVFSPKEVESLRNAVDALVAAPPASGNQTWRSPATGGGLVVQRISRANLVSDSVARDFLGAPQLSSLGAGIFEVSSERVLVADGLEGSDGIVLVIKNPANVSVHKDLRWHRDETFTQHLDINPFVNCGLYLDRSDDLRGGLLVIPNTLSLPNRVEETTLPVSGQICVSADPGDVVIHRADILHRSGPHKVAGEIRRVLYANLYVRHDRH